jgi:hypothetical protein
MKKHIIAQALFLVAAASAQAQTAAPAQLAPAVEDRNATQFVKVNVAPPAASSVNPFSGVSLGVEELQKRLEVSKLQTQLLEENLRNAALQEDLKNIPIRKQAEIAQASTQVTREAAQRAQLEREARAQVEAEEAAREEAVRQRREASEARKAAVRRAAEEEKRRAEEAALTRKAPVEAAVVAPRIEVLSVTNVGSKRSALLAINANIASVNDGDETPLGRVSISASGQVSINGVAQTMQQANIARVKLSEPAGTTAASNRTGASSSAAPPTLVIGSQPAPEQSTAAPTFVPPPVPGTPGNANTRTTPVPQIQLPAGVSLVPSAR